MMDCVDFKACIWLVPVTVEALVFGTSAGSFTTTVVVDGPDEFCESVLGGGSSLEKECKGAKKESLLFVHAGKK